MAKVIRTFAADNGMVFDDVCSFKTESHIGLYDGCSSQFVLIPMADSYLNITPLGNPGTLSDLCDAVKEVCDEDVLEVFDRSDYVIRLE